MRLTKQIVENAKLPAKGQAFLWDSETKGFGLRLTPTTRAYVVQARVNGIARRVTLGRHGILTVQEARKKAIKELSKMLDGKDPVIEKKRAVAQSVTLEEVVEDYLKDRLTSHYNHQFLFPQILFSLPNMAKQLKSYDFYIEDNDS